VEAPEPQNISQMKAFLGMINYYSKFLSNLSMQLAPLYRFLQKNTTWKWGKDQQQAFEEAKHLLTSSQVLAHYDSQKNYYWHVMHPPMEWEQFYHIEWMMDLNDP